MGEIVKLKVLKTKPDEQVEYHFERLEALLIEYAAINEDFPEVKTALDNLQQSYFWWSMFKSD